MPQGVIEHPSLAREIVCQPAGSLPHPSPSSKVCDLAGLQDPCHEEIAIAVAYLTKNFAKATPLLNFVRRQSDHCTVVLQPPEVVHKAVAIRYMPSTTADMARLTDRKNSARSQR